MDKATNPLHNESDVRKICDNAQRFNLAAGVSVVFRVENQRLVMSTHLC